MPAVTVVEGVEIPERLIAEEAQHHPGLSAAEARRAAGHALATKALLLDRARRLGLEPQPEFDADGREETREEALIRAVLTAEVEVATPDEATCRRVYESRVAGQANAPDYAAVRERIAETLAHRAWTSAAGRFVAGLAAEARTGGIAISLADDGAVAHGSATLGGLVTDGAAERLPGWLAAADPGLAAKVADAATREGRGAAAYVRATFQAFVQTADDAAWTRVVSAAQGADDPALAALAAVLSARLTPAPALHTVVRRR